MANKTIHELSPASTMSGNYEFAVYDIDGSTTKKATADQILNTSDLLYADDSEEESEEVDFTTQDETQNPEIQTVTKLVGTDSWSQRFFKISQMFQNIRYLINKLGTTDISSLSTEGTVTGALSTLDDKLDNKIVTGSYNSTTASSISSNGTAWLSFQNIGRTGYRIAGIAGYYLQGTNANGCIVYAMYPNIAGDSIGFAVRNLTSSAATGVFATVYLTYLKQ